MTESRNYILDAAAAEKKLRRMAYQVLENNMEEKSLVLAGVRESGSVVARMMQQMLSEISSIQTEVITISLDKKKPADVTISKQLDFNNKVVIVIDDVANSGRTLLYALKPFLEYLPKKIQTLVLVERSHNTFPVHSDYAGLTIATTRQEHIYVEVDGDKVTGAYLD